MSDVTGTVRATLSGAEYTLRLTMRGLAQLQSEFGKDLGGLLSGGFKSGDMPDFTIPLRVVEVALLRGMPDLQADRVKDIADDLLTGDQGLVARLMVAAFPDAAADAAQADPGNAERPGQAA